MVTQGFAVVFECLREIAQMGLCDASDKQNLRVEYAIGDGFGGFS